MKIKNKGRRREEVEAPCSSLTLIFLILCLKFDRSKIKRVIFLRNVPHVSGNKILKIMLELKLFTRKEMVMSAKMHKDINNEMMYYEQKLRVWLSLKVQRRTMVKTWPFNFILLIHYLFFYIHKMGMYNFAPI